MAMRLGTELPLLSGATEWLGDPLRRDELIGAPTLVHFWSVSCYLCKQNYPIIRGWREEFADKGLRVVAVHMPRQEEDMSVARVRESIHQLDLKEPCAIDNEHSLKEAFENREGWVPAYFLFSAEGVLKSRTAGESGLVMMRGALERIFEG
jgi:thiol-disulfide isomerase/thioredoxin